MRVLILHAEIAPDAPPDDQDTLRQAAAIAEALTRCGHESVCGVFFPDESEMEALIARENPDVVFNLVESFWGRGLYAPLAPAILASLGVPYTGADAAAMSACGDKILTKRILEAAALPTPAWSEAPHW